MIKPEYPNPQFERAEWMNLHGEWEFFSDYSNEGLDRKLKEKDAVYPERITVPFCRESKLSGIGETGFCNCVWYKKNVTIPKNWAESGFFCISADAIIIPRFGSTENRWERIAAGLYPSLSILRNILKWTEKMC